MYNRKHETIVKDKDGNKFFRTNDVIYFKPFWSPFSRKIMYKPKGQAGRWTMEFKKNRQFVNGEPAFYTTLLYHLLGRGNEIVIARIFNGTAVSTSVFPIDMLVASNVRIGNGILQKCALSANLLKDLQGESK